MMKTTKGVLAALLCACTITSVAQNQAISYQTQEPPVAESDTAIATRFALKFADSLVKANFYQNWPTYTALSIPSAVKYYGGKDAFRDHVVIFYYRNEPKLEEKPEKLKLITLMNDIDNWQCVIEKVRDTWINDRKAKVYTYLIGESPDNGLTWKFIDVSHNTMQNVIYLMPTIFGNLAIPEGRTEFKD
jgi:hypothetical protein